MSSLLTQLAATHGLALWLFYTVPGELDVSRDSKVFRPNMQHEAELIQAEDDSRRRYHEACEVCGAEELRLFRLEERLICAQEEVNGF